MARKWEDVGPNKVKLTIDAGGGAPLQVFYGKTREDIHQQLEVAQENATRRMHELRTGNPTQPAQQPQQRRSVAPRPLQPGDRMQLVADMSDPNKIDSAVGRIVESIIGPTDAIRQATAANEEEAEASEAVAVAAKFADETPDWYPSAYNRSTLIRYMTVNRLSPTNFNHYNQAFQELMSGGLLQQRPEEENEDAPEETEPVAERIAPARTTGQIRSRATGVRSSQMGGTPARPTTKLKYTREQIDKMGKAKYAELMRNDPEFGRSIDALYAPKSSRRAG